MRGMVGSVHRRRDLGLASLAIMIASSTRASIVAARGPSAGAFGASWSPDGSRLAFSLVSPGQGSPDIATIAIDGTGLEILTTDPAKEEIPA